MKVGVVGAGWIARKVHVPWLLGPEAKALGVVLVAVWDDNPERLREFAESFGVVGASSLSAMFELDLDLALVLTDPQSHVAIVDRALAEGCHVICEKPLALRGVDVERLAAQAEAARLCLFTCMTATFRSDLRALRDTIRTGDIGFPRYVRAGWLRDNGIPGSHGTRRAGPLWDLGSHLTHAALWLTGWQAPKQVTAGFSVNSADTAGAAWLASAGGSAVLPALNDSTNMLVEFAESKQLYVETSWNANVGADITELFVVASRGSARLSSTWGFSPNRDPARHVLERAIRGQPGWSAIPYERQAIGAEYSTQLRELVEATQRRDRAASAQSLRVVRDATDVLERAHASASSAEKAGR